MASNCMLDVIIPALIACVTSSPCTLPLGPLPLISLSVIPACLALNLAAGVALIFSSIYLPFTCLIVSSLSSISCLFIVVLSLSFK